jgi:hypothetical protein
MSMKRVFGWMLLFAVLGGLVVATGVHVGWSVALFAFGFAVLIPALVWLALWLINE